MTRSASLVRLGIFTSFTLALASACGGQSFTNDGGEAGKTSSAGKDQGGSANRAGSSGSAGKNSKAGSNAGGTTSMGGAGNAGTGNVGAGGVGSGGGPASEECSAAPVSGPCDAAIASWYHDPSSGLCRPFTYGGCEGNANRYDSLAACQKACPGGTPNYDACKQATDCVVTGTGCCGICDGAGISAHDLIAYNKQYAGQLQCGIALDIAGSGGSTAAGAAAPIACAPCPQPPPGQGSLMYFVPDCVQGQCTVVDLRTSPVTACKTSDECKLRDGTGCCEGCGNASPFSVRNDGSFEKLVCGDGPVACDACAPLPTAAVPFCEAGRCQALIPL